MYVLFLFLIHRGVTCVIVVGKEVIWRLVEASEDTFLFPLESWKKPGGVSCFSFSRMFLDSMSTTWLIIGLRLAVAWVQKKATFMYFITSSESYVFSSGSTSSNSFSSSYSSHAYCYITRKKKFKNRPLSPNFFQITNLPSLTAYPFQ